MTLRVIKVSDEKLCKSCFLTHQEYDNLVMVIGSCTSTSFVYNNSLTEEYVYDSDEPSSFEDLRAVKKELEKLKNTKKGTFSIVSIPHLIEKHTYCLYASPIDWEGIKYMAVKGSKLYVEMTETLFLTHRFISQFLDKDSMCILLEVLYLLFLESHCVMSLDEKCERALELGKNIL